MSNEAYVIVMCREDYYGPDRYHVDVVWPTLRQARADLLKLDREYMDYDNTAFSIVHATWEEA